MNTEFSERPPSVAALLAALDGYLAWLSCFEGRPGSMPTNMGQHELKTLLDIRRADFPHLGTYVTEILAMHTRLAGVVYAQQRRRARAETGGQPHVECERFVRTQAAAIDKLRRAATPTNYERATAGTWHRLFSLCWDVKAEGSMAGSHRMEQ